jgi:RNA polymerase sigma factor (sigma-70 family)
MSQVQHDDHDAFVELLPRLGPAIGGSLRSLPMGEIEDGRAEVHLRLWSRRMQYREDRGTVRAWACGISRHYALDWFRKQSRAPRLMADLDGLAVADRHLDPALATEEADWAAHARRISSEVLAGFPPHVQDCFRLRMQGVSYAKIAELVGPRPIGTVASAVHRVRTKLLAHLEAFVNPVPKIGENIMVIDPRITSMQNDIDQIKAQLSATEGGLKADVGGIKNRLDNLEQQVRELGDTAASRATQVLDRLGSLIADPTQHGSDTDWAFVEDLVDELLKVKKLLPNGLLIRVQTRLKESRELLKKVPGHRAAIDQLRGVEKLLERVATGVRSP